MIAAVGIRNKMSKDLTLAQWYSQRWARVGLVHSVAPPKVKASVMMI